MVDTIGARVAHLIDSTQPSVTQREIASRIGMTTDAFSRAVNDKRAFSSIELARLATELGTDVYWLITGDEDPNRLVFAARHDYDSENRQHVVPSKVADSVVLEDIHTAYRQAFVENATLPSLPGTPKEMAVTLGADFVLPFIERIESNLSVDVIRVAELATAYSFMSKGRFVIAIQATGNWFRENWGLAHELAHLAGRQNEPAANAFAADLLLPESTLRQVDWAAVTNAEVARFVWGAGVSTDALQRRLRSLRIPTSNETVLALDMSTQALLRHHWIANESDRNALAKRTEKASARRFPRSLVEAHQDAIADGRIGPAFLAWMLGVEAGALEVERPDVDELPTDKTEELASLLGLSLG